MNFSAVILAGGKSSRMGCDKAFLEIGGQTLLARQIQIVREAGATEVFISGRTGVDYSAFGCRVLHDQFPDAGPLAGIHAALLAVSNPLLFALAVDLPEMTSAFLRGLAAKSIAGAGVIPRVAGQIEPLAAIYPRTAVELATTRLRGNNFSVRDFADACVKTGQVVFEDFPAAAAPLFHNCNQPADLPCLT
jgi:molybdopterin-guanine dinucleotide biosynthesis protein A